MLRHTHTKKMRNGIRETTASQEDIQKTNDRQNLKKVKIIERIIIK